jgi:hypothetical protein
MGVKTSYIKFNMRIFVMFFTIGGESTKVFDAEPEISVFFISNQALL